MWGSRASAECPGASRMIRRLEEIVQNRLQVFCNSKNLNFSSVLVFSDANFIAVGLSVTDVNFYNYSSSKSFLVLTIQQLMIMKKLYQLKPIVVGMRLVKVVCKQNTLLFTLIITNINIYLYKERKQY